jgi:hypothetical protein
VAENREVDEHGVTERVFVSYSHQDASLVTPVVRLLRSTNEFVFLDSDSIKPGQKWRQALSDAMDQASLVVVFWCAHSNRSAEVESEYLSAIAARKDVLPVLLDSTPVPPALDQYQWIDFRELGQGRHPTENLVGARPSAPRAPSLRLPWLGAVAASAALFVVLMSASFWMLRSSGPTDSAVPMPPVTLPAPDAPSGSPSWVVAVAVLLTALAVIVAIAMKRPRPVAQDARTDNRQDKEMADALEEELRRRLRPAGT